VHERVNDVLTQAVLRYAVERMRMDPPPLDHPRSEAELRAMVGSSITPAGVGGLEALRRWSDVLAPACLSIDHPRYLAFVPCAPTDAATLFELVVGASGLFGGTWLEAAGAVYAENEALRWVADLAGFPPSAGGVFVSGGSAANLSALAAARFRWRRDHPEHDRSRGLILTSAGAHASIAAAARLLDADLVAAPADERGRLRGAELEATVDALAPHDRARAFAVVATGGTTNVGVVDDLAGAADVAAGIGAWFHADAAYGGAALAVPSARKLFTGIERADSFVVDPHKWLFAPFDCAALVYRDPDVARATHTQHAEYLDVIHREPEWNPSDYAYHLTRRARGLPFWFSLATYGTDAYAAAVDSSLRLARDAAALVRAHPNLELVVEPELSVVVFRRPGWTAGDYQAWSDRLLEAQVAFVVPSSFDGETVLRFCFVHPRTTVDDVRAILATL
jgi:glutamate/tyrosine decarboxylase-like PLP-dependent enzyme